MWGDQLEAGTYEIQIVDITKQPYLAKANKILAIPTIVRIKPLPERRIIGDMRQPEKAVRALEFLMDEIESALPVSITCSSSAVKPCARTSGRIKSQQRTRTRRRITIFHTFQNLRLILCINFVSMGNKKGFNIIISRL